MIMAETMAFSVSLGKLVALFGAMAMLAALPSVSVLAVTAKSASSGFTQGVLTALGIVVGDIIFILVAVFGLVLLVQTLGAAFALVKYACGAYLIWLGLRLWRSKSQQAAQAGGTSSWFESFLTGLLITLGDQKAILFYIGFFPAFFDLTQLTYVDVGAVILVTLGAVGGVKVGYAYAADKASLFLSGRVVSAMNRIAAGMMLVAGIVVMVRR